MDHLTFLLTGPGGLLVALFFGSTLAEDSQARSDLTVTLGIVFWLVVLAALRLALHLAAKRAAVAADGRPGGPLRRWWHGRLLPHLRPGASGLASWQRRWSWRLVWGVLWRAQASHAVVYAGLPLVWVAVRLVLLAITVPLWVIGPGAGPTATDAALDHLRLPACWTFATPCAGPRSAFVSALWRTPADCVGAGPGAVCRPGRSLYGDRGGWAAKGLWAALASGWIWAWRRRARRPGGAGPNERQALAAEAPAKADASRRGPRPPRAAPPTTSPPSSSTPKSLPPR